MIEQSLTLQPEQPIAVTLGDRFSSPWRPTRCDAAGQEIIIANRLSPECLVDVWPMFEPKGAARLRHGGAL